MKHAKIIGLGAVCFVIVLGIAMLVASSLGDILENQQERNYNRFVSNVDGLTNTFRHQVEECAQKQVESNDDDCIKSVIAEYQVQFGTLIKLFGYEVYLEKLYRYWQADLQYWYDLKKIELQYSDNPKLLESEIKRISEIREKSVNARLQPELATRVESGQ